MQIRKLARLLHKQHQDHHPETVKRTGVRIFLAWSPEIRANSSFQLRLLKLLYNKWFTCPSWTICDFDTKIPHCHCRFRRRIAVLHASTQLSYTSLSSGGKEKKPTSFYFKGNCSSNRLLVLETKTLLIRSISYKSTKWSESSTPHLGEHHHSGNHQISLCQLHCRTPAFLGGLKAVHSSLSTFLQSDKLKTCKTQLNILLLKRPDVSSEVKMYYDLATLELCDSDLGNLQFHRIVSL